MIFFPKIQDNSQLDCIFKLIFIYSFVLFMEWFYSANADSFFESSPVDSDSSISVYSSNCIRSFSDRVSYLSLSSTFERCHRNEHFVSHLVLMRDSVESLRLTMPAYLGKIKTEKS